ncbi:MAG: hypothetical protein ACFFDN_51330, partial [Candidatus Hodarchaeota archaeon]
TLTYFFNYFTFGILSIMLFSPLLVILRNQIKELIVLVVLITISSLLLFPEILGIVLAEINPSWLSQITIDKIIGFFFGFLWERLYILTISVLGFFNVLLLKKYMDKRYDFLFLFSISIIMGLISISLFIFILTKSYISFRFVIYSFNIIAPFLALKIVFHSNNKQFVIFNFEIIKTSIIKRFKIQNFYCLIFIVLNILNLIFIFPIPFNPVSNVYANYVNTSGEIEIIEFIENNLGLERFQKIQYNKFIVSDDEIIIRYYGYRPIKTHFAYRVFGEIFGVNVSRKPEIPFNTTIYLVITEQMFQNVYIPIISSNCGVLNINYEIITSLRQKYQILYERGMYIIFSLHYYEIFPLKESPWFGNYINYNSTKRT